MINVVIGSYGTFYMKTTKPDWWIEVKRASICSKIVKALSDKERLSHEPAGS
jgi:hypothetical protein